jgi:hypothetical protein
MPTLSKPRRRGAPPSAAEPTRGAHIEFLDCSPVPMGALRSNRAAFTHIALAFAFGRSDSFALRKATDEDRALLRKHFPDLLSSFEANHGAICRSYFARSVYASAVLTEHDEIAIALGCEIPQESRDLVELLLRCQQVGYLAWHRLAEYDRRLCQNMVYSVVEELLRRLDQRAAEHAGKNGKSPAAVPASEIIVAVNGRGRRTRREDELDGLREHLDEAEDFMLRCATRRAQLRYLRGMLTGTAAIAAVIGAVTARLAATGALSGLAGQLLAVATAGAVGAAVSVLARMTSGTFRMNLPTLNFEMRGTDLWLMGALRPVIGVVFGLASYVFVHSGLVPLEPGKGETPTFLFTAVGFLAGFSERFAQDMFVRSGQGLAGPMGDSPSSGPSAGLAPPAGSDPARAPRARRA